MQPLHETSRTSQVANNMMNGQRFRSRSAPALRINSGSYSRARSRQTAVDYEQGKDRIAHWIGAWSCEEVYRKKGPLRFLFNAYF